MKRFAMILMCFVVCFVFSSCGTENAIDSGSTDVVETNNGTQSAYASEENISDNENISDENNVQNTEATTSVNPTEEQNNDIEDLACPRNSFGFNSISDLTTFYNAKKKYLGRNYLMLDADKIASSVDNVLYSCYSLTFDNSLWKTVENLDEQLSNPIFYLDMKLYSEELGHKTYDDDMEMLYVSIQMEVCFYGIAENIETLSFEFSEYSCSPFCWKNKAIVYSGDEIIAEIFYLAYSDAEQWLTDMVLNNCLVLKGE